MLLTKTENKDFILVRDKMNVHSFILHISICYKVIFALFTHMFNLFYISPVM